MEAFWCHRFQCVDDVQSFEVGINFHQEIGDSSLFLAFRGRRDTTTRYCCQPPPAVKRCCPEHCCGKAAFYWLQTRIDI
jgi:hypothetical protein